jgi:penicillin-binding protein 2
MFTLNGIDKKEPTDLPRQFSIALWIVIAVFFGIAARLWFLQIVKAPYFKDLSEHNRTRVLSIPASRGAIFDRQGIMLVNSNPSFDLYIIPDDVQNWDILKDQLGRILDMDPESIKQRLDQKKDNPNYPIPIKLDISQEELGLLETFKYLIPGVYIQVSPRRNYPLGVVAPHVIGYLGEITQKQLKSSQFPNNKIGDLIGQWGLEKEWQDVLGGKKGGRIMEVDAAGQEIQLLNIQEPTAGINLETTLDWTVQKAAQEAFAGKKGAVVVLSPDTGEVLAMYSSPAFDPSSFNRKLTIKEWNTLFNNPDKPMQNRAIQGQYPPGSTYKMIAALAGLEEKVISPETTFHCSGGMAYGNRVFHCWNKRGHGTVNLHKALVQSCDVYFYNLGIRLGVDRLARYAQLLGLGQPTGVGLTPEKGGIVPTSAWKLKRFKTPWAPGETLSVSIGQGYNTATPLQMALATAAIANGGTVYKPHLIKKVIAPQGKVIKEFFPQKIRQIQVNPESLNVISKGLAGVINEPGGTGGASRLPGILAAGKTGTAQVVTLGKKGARDHAWFIAYAPVEKPQLAMAVIVEHGGHGGEAAAPIARKIFQAYFHLPPRGSKPATSRPNTDEAPQEEPSNNNND